MRHLIDSPVPPRSREGRVSQYSETSFVRREPYHRSTLDHLYSPRNGSQKSPSCKTRPNLFSSRYQYVKCLESQLAAFSSAKDLFWDA
jgi:hypothetical protein